MITDGFEKKKFTVAAFLNIKATFDYNAHA